MALMPPASIVSDSVTPPQVTDREFVVPEIGFVSVMGIALPIVCRDGRRYTVNARSRNGTGRQLVSCPAGVRTAREHPQIVVRVGYQIDGQGAFDVAVAGCAVAQVVGIAITVVALVGLVLRVAGRDSETDQGNTVIARISGTGHIAQRFAGLESDVRCTTAVGCELEPGSTDFLAVAVVAGAYVCGVVVCCTAMVGYFGCR